MKDKTATFWFDEDSAHKIRSEVWAASILRMDNWCLCAQPVFLDAKLIGGERWVGNDP